MTSQQQPKLTPRQPLVDAPDLVYELIEDWEHVRTGIDYEMQWEMWVGAFIHDVDLQQYLEEGAL